jgi:ATP-dependent Clp protease protease subunit
MIRIRESLYSVISKHTGQDMDKIKKDADRDNWMSSQEALDYGIIDKIL